MSSMITGVWLDEAASLDKKQYDLPELPEHGVKVGVFEKEEPNYCATCSYAGRCAGYCAVPPDTMSRYPLRNGRNPFLYRGDDE